MFQQARESGIGVNQPRAREPRAATDQDGRSKFASSAEFVGKGDNNIGVSN